MEDFNRDKFYRNIVSLFKLFRNRPHHLAKYLLDNDVFNHDFINNIINSEKLSDLSKNPFSYDMQDGESNSTTYFLSFSEMNEYYNAYLEGDISDVDNDIEIECNLKLSKLIEEEKYEEASKLRDYMIKNDITIKH